MFDIRKTLFACCALLGLSAADAQQPTDIVVPNKIQQEWAEAELGVLIHFDMPVYRPAYNWRQWGSHPDPSVFHPTRLDTDQWLETAQKMGAKYAVLVAKHCSGFSLWPTEAHDYSIKHSPYKDGKGDIVKDFIASCHKYGVRPGLYASTTANGYLWVDNPGRVQPGGPVTQEEYNKIVVQQLTELWSNYGPLFEIWFDGGVLSKEQGGADVLSLVQKLQPQAIAFQGPMGHPNLIRWVGNEEGTSPYPCWATADAVTQADGTKKVSGLHGNPLAPYWCPGEADCTLRKNGSFQGGWFWHADEDDQLFTVGEMMEKYVTSVGRNTNMLVGLVVDDEGLVPEADAARAAEFGAAVKQRFGHPEQVAKGKGYALTIALPAATEIDGVVLQEDIAQGERVLDYLLEGRDGGEWTTLATGSNIGHKRIAQFPARKVQEVRLRILRAKAEPHIASFAVYRKK